MGRNKKTPKVPGFMRHVVAVNVRRRMDHVFSDSPNKPLALARKTGDPGKGGLSLSTVQRILGEQSGASLDNLEAVATALDLSLYQLMIPALDIENPQIVVGAMKDEERMYRTWRKERVVVAPRQPPRAQEKQTTKGESA